ncbi:MAG: oligosaccharide flippase family protein [Pseudomonadota bacterium]
MSVQRNLVANYIAQAWTALMGLAFIPAYIHLLGMEAYGLIGFFALLQAWLLLLDMGMSFVLNREMARFSAGAHDAQSIRNLLRSVEYVALVVAALIALVVMQASGWLATGWLRAQTLAPGVVTEAIAVMGFVVAARLVESLYHGAILGLQRQVWLAIANSMLVTLRWAGALGVLMWVDGSIRAFFLWQGAVSLLAIVVFAVALYRQLPKAGRPATFSVESLRGLWRFAAGLVASTALALLLTQVDKILLSKLLSLESFGVYALAGVVATALLQLVTPVTQAYYPRLTALLTSGDEPGLVRAYHEGAQIVCALMVPAALLLIVFPASVLGLWTGDAALAERAAPLLCALAAGTMLNGFMNMPYMLQLAHGWSSLAARVNAVAALVLVPALLWVTPRYGALGAAWVWVALNAGYLTVGIALMHRRVLRSEKAVWYFADVALPALAAAIATVLMYAVKPSGPSAIVEFVWLMATGLLSLMASITAAPLLRQRVLARLQPTQSSKVMP